MGRSPCCPKDGGLAPLKKGAWTPEEDQRLTDYIKNHGHGNWRALPKKCGLQRCGKSCRLRWTNYLRPDIKRGSFSTAEEQKIIQLHALVGNKWAFIASQLPKRTDNEIKNYWNTVLKKRTQPPAAAPPPPPPPPSAANNHNLFMQTHHSAATSNSPLHLVVDNLLRNQQKMMKLMISATTKSTTPASAASDGGIHERRRNSSSSAGSNHLAQWESARLEAEARLAQQSKWLNSKPSGAPSASVDWLFRAKLPTPAACSAASINPIFLPQTHTFAMDSQRRMTSSGSNSVHRSSSLPTDLAIPSMHHTHYDDDDDRATTIASCSFDHSNPAELVFQSSSINSHAQSLTKSFIDRNLLHPSVVNRQSEGGGGGATCRSAAVADSSSAIKLGPNGRLSWNRHELTLPNLIGNPPSILNFLQNANDSNGFNTAAHRSRVKNEPAEHSFPAANVGAAAATAASSVNSLLSSAAMESILSSFNDIDEDVDEISATRAADPPISFNERFKISIVGDVVATTTEESGGDNVDDNSAGSMISFNMSSMLQDFYSSLQQQQQQASESKVSMSNVCRGGEGIMRSSSCGSNIHVFDVDLCNLLASTSKSSCSSSTANVTEAADELMASQQQLGGGAGGGAGGSATAAAAGFNSSYVSQGLNFQQLECLLGETSEAQFNNLLMDLNLC